MTRSFRRERDGSRSAVNADDLTDAPEIVGSLARCEEQTDAVRRAIESVAARGSRQGGAARPRQGEATRLLTWLLRREDSTAG
jgi:hypothetical protein